MAKPKAKRAPFKNADADFSKTGHPRKTRLTLFRRATLLHKNYGAAVYLLVKFQEKYWAYSSAPKPTHHEHQHELSTDLEAENERLTALVQDLQVQLAQKQNSDLAPHSSATATGNVDPLTGPRSPSFPPSLSYIRREVPAPDREIWYHEDVKDVPYEMQFLSFPRKGTHFQHGEVQPVAATFGQAVGQAATVTGSVQKDVSSCTPPAGDVPNTEHGAGQASDLQYGPGSRYDPDLAMTWPEFEPTGGEEEDDDDLGELSWVPWVAAESIGDNIQPEGTPEEQASDEDDPMDLSLDETGALSQSAGSHVIDESEHDNSFEGVAEECDLEEGVFREDVSFGHHMPKGSRCMITPRTPRSYRSLPRRHSWYNRFRNPDAAFMRELSCDRGISPASVATDRLGPYLSPTQTAHNAPSPQLYSPTPGSPARLPSETPSLPMTAQDTSSMVSPSRAATEKFEKLSPSHRRLNFVIRWEDISRPQGRSVETKPDARPMIRRSRRWKECHA